MAPRIGETGWVPRWRQVADWRREHGGVSGGKGAKRRQGRGHTARLEYKGKAR